MENRRIFLLLPLLAAVTFAYDIGVTHHYKYDTSVVVNEKCADVTEGGDSIGHGLKAEVRLTVLWQDSKSRQKLMKIQVTEPKLLVSKKSSALEERKSDLEEISAWESFFLLQDNRVQKFWDNADEHSDLRNLKRSVATLLQVGRKDGEERMDGVSGQCEVLYKVEGQTVRRSVGKCRHPLQDSVRSQPYGVRSSTVHRSTGIDCDLQEGGSTVSKCVAIERLNTYSNLWKRSAICVQSVTTFALVRVSKSDEGFKVDDYQKVIQELRKKGELVEGSVHSVSRNLEEQKLADISESTLSFKESLKAGHLAKLKSASAFFKLLPVFRAANKQDVLKLLQNKKFAPILPQILDVVAASSTKDSVQAALTHFDKVKDYDENLERFLISISVSPRPESFILEEIKAFLEKGGHHEKIEATLIASLGTLLGTYSRTEQRTETKVVEEILGHLESGLKKCGTEACALAHLRGLRNAALRQSTPLLLQYALRGGRPALEALLALRSMHTPQLSRENQEALLKVFRQVGAKQDRSSRAVAAEMLLKGSADADVLRAVLGSLSDQTDAEFSSFVVSKVLRCMDEDEKLRSRLLKLLSEKEISHYYSLSQKGKSSLFKRQLMSTGGVNVTYGIEMELLEGGLLKRSAFDVEFETDSELSNLLSVVMFAEGMGSFAGESSSNDDAASDPTAGMELTLLGSSLRPYVFFTGTSELMSHAWSGTASEPTPALQGLFSLCDDPHLAILHNGMVVRLEWRGVMSTDMSASIQISLWYKSSHSSVKNAAAILVKGSAVVESGVARTRGESQFYGHSNIDFGTDLEFDDSPFKMCLQMEHPDAVFKHDFQRGVNGAKFSIKKTKKRKRFIPGRSYALHQNNNDLCRIMKSSPNE